MAATGTLFDNYDDNSINATKWPNNYGTVSETGGRARITCDTDYSAYASDVTYSFDETVVFGRMFPPVDGGATDEAYLQVLVVSDTAGTDLGVEINAATGDISFFTRVGYFDAGLVSIT
ncbi:MAG: hypothetical protein PHQ28_10035, partial [Mycobacterium sp.]|nr:hypothetical protein [Mycobacterium sp.]